MTRTSMLTQLENQIADLERKSPQSSDDRKSLDTLRETHRKLKVAFAKRVRGDKNSELFATL